MRSLVPTLSVEEEVMETCSEQNAGQADTRICYPASSMVREVVVVGSGVKEAKLRECAGDVRQEVGCCRASGLVWDSEVPDGQDVSCASE